MKTWSRRARPAAFLSGVLLVVAAVQTRGSDYELMAPTRPSFPFMLRLEKGAPDRQADYWLGGGFLNGKFRITACGNAAAEGQLSFQQDAVKGEWDVEGAGSPMRYKYTLAASVGGATATGTFTARAVNRADGAEKAKWTGPVTGTVQSFAALQKDNAVDANKGWPCWSGPNLNLTAEPCGVPLVDTLARARLIWRSQETTPPALSAPQGAMEQALRCMTMRPGSGGTSPAVASGRLYLRYHVPWGDAVDEAELEAAEQERIRHPEWGFKAMPARARDFFRKRSDEVVLCLDAASGQTLWKAVLRNYSANPRELQQSPTNLTPAVGLRMVSCLLTGGQIIGQNAETGRVLWEYPVTAEPLGERDFSNSPACIGGVFLAGNHRGRLGAFEPRMARELWKLDGGCDPRIVPSRWVNEGKEYAVVLGTRTVSGRPAGTIRCLEPRTGKELWTLDGSFAGQGLCVQGNILIALAKPSVEGAVNKGLECLAFRLTPDKAQPLWSAPCPYVTENLAPVADEEHVYLGGKDETHMLELKTGRELVAWKGPGVGDEGYAWLADGRLFISAGDAHGVNSILMLGTTPETFKPLGAAPWTPPHPNTSGSRLKPMVFPIVDGRLFLRGSDGVYCYDLRKKN